MSCDFSDGELNFDFHYLSCFDCKNSNLNIIRGNRKDARAVVNNGCERAKKLSIDIRKILEKFSNHSEGALHEPRSDM